MTARAAAIGISRHRLRLALFALFGIGFLALAVPAFAEPMTFWTGIVLGDYAFPTHELHHFVLGAVFTVLLVAVVAQAFRPANRVGALHAAIVLWCSLTVVFAIGGEFSPMHLLLLGLLVGMAATHPAGTAQFPTREGLEPLSGVVAVITAVGGLALAGVELNAHFVADDHHTGFGHYLFMATTGLAIAGLSLYSSLRGIGWRFPAYVVALLLAVIGVTSIAYPGPEQGSSLGVGLGLVVVVWAAIVVIVFERGEELAGRLHR